MILTPALMENAYAPNTGLRARVEGGGVWSVRRSKRNIITITTIRAGTMIVRRNPIVAMLNERGNAPEKMV